MGGIGRFIGRAAVCLPLSLLMSAYLLLRAANPAPGYQDHGYSLAVAAVVSTAATAFALLQAASPGPLGRAAVFSALGAVAAFLVGGFLFGPV